MSDTPMSTTPITDVERESVFEKVRTIKSFDWIDGIESFADFARTLETELTAALARVGELEKDLDACEGSQEVGYSKSLERQLSETQESLKLSQHDAAQERLRIAKLEGILSETQAQLASAREDSARLDWLEKNMERVFHRISQDGIWYFDLSEMRQKRAENIRSAIDAARGVSRTEPPASATGEPASAWQPIETAPRDGTMVLLFGMRSGSSEGLIAFGYYGKWNLPNGDEDWMVDYGRFFPTHWQPLPPPPTGKEEGT